jgi:putative transposase
MKRMGMAAIYRRPNTSKPAPGHKIYPCLLRGMKVEAVDHVWAMDISTIPMRRGFVYLAAVVDVASPRVLAHRVSITMETAFCVEALEEAMVRHGKPMIFNADQSSQFTSHAFTSLLAAAGISTGMDGKGAWRDNVFVERFWRSIKYEEVYPKAYDSVPEARSSISKSITFSNSGRPHSSLDGRTPDEACFGGRQPAAGSRQPADGRWQPAAGSRQPAAGRWPWPPERRPRFCRRSGRATPSRRRDEIAKPRIRHPAGGPLRFRAALSDQAGPPLFCVAHTAPRIRGYRHEPRWVCRRL